MYRDPRYGKKQQAIYVGKGLVKKNRADSHWNGHNKHNRLLVSVLKKIRSDGLEPIIEIIAGFDDEENAYRLEKKLITLFGRRDLRTGTLCNLTDGGEGTIGTIRVTPKSPSPEARAKMSAAHMGQPSPRKGQHLSPDTKAKLSIAHKGRILPAEQRAKMSAAHRGKPKSLEMRNNLSIAKKGKPSPLRGRTIPPEIRAKISAAKKGKPGQPRSAETRAKMSASHKGKAAWNKGIPAWNRGWRKGNPPSLTPDD